MPEKELLTALIIEDEPAAARRLINLVQEADPQIRILETIDSVSAAQQWFDMNAQPDLMFVDINLGDGLSFNIFETRDIRCPVIFTTAYDQYAIKAFKTNSIDYLLKPIKKEELVFALDKLRRLRNQSDYQMEGILHMLEDLKKNRGDYKERFVVNYGDKIRSIITADVAYFMVYEKNTFLTTHSNESFGINFSLDQLEGLLDPGAFFRVNRKFLISFHAIVNMWQYSLSRVKLGLKPPPPEDVIVSTDRSGKFKEWLNK